MARLIDADRMREDWLENGENEYVYDTNAVLESIDEQPTVDAVEVVHGKWETYPCDIYMRCSVCRREFDKRKNTFDGNYCPHCGAKMDGGEKA